MPYIDVREPHTDKLLFRYDPERRIIEIQSRGVKTTVDLTRYDGTGEIGRMGIILPLSAQADSVTTTSI